uniref:Zinc finger protein 414 n=1 Tax=Ficedula albicollis TaxID=59894 RepID=A0A803WBQ3_FICAL
MPGGMFGGFGDHAAVGEAGRDSDSSGRVSPTSRGHRGEEEKEEEEEQEEEGTTPQAPLLCFGGMGRAEGCCGRASPAVPAGCSAPALGSAPMAVAGSSGTPELRPLKRRPVPGEPSPAPGRGQRQPGQSRAQQTLQRGCPRRAAAESLSEFLCPGKTFHCPTLGCTETFPSMQDLMAHMKVHYKPNRYFKCENCLLRFRTHRSLFKHLHVCSDSASGPAPPPKPDKPVLPPTTSVPEKEPPCPQCPQPELAVPFAAGPHFGLLPLGRDPLSVRGLEPQPRGTTRLRASPGRARGDPGAIPVLPCPPVLAGHSSNSRIVWEHTRGRYSCTQCPFSTASREEMTLHIEDHRKNPPPGRLEADMGTGGTPGPGRARQG